MDNQPTLNTHNNNKTLWIIFGIISSLIPILATAILVVCLARGGQNRTIMVYMIGSDLESQHASASLDITEMKESYYNPEHTKILIYTGGATSWTLDDISADENAIFELSNGQLNKVMTYDQGLMTDYRNLETFINYAYDNYPANMYDLVLWDHGGGPIFGYGLDEYADGDDSMDIPSLTKALSQSKLVHDGKKFDLIGFDACLMGSAEVARMLAPYSNYMLASEEMEPGDGWDYHFLNDFGEEKITSTEDMGRSIIDHYTDYYNDYSYGYEVNTSLSLINLRNIGELVDAFSALFTNVKEEINPQTFSQYSRLMTRERVYGYTGRDSQSYDLVDLMDLCGSLRAAHGSGVDGVEKALADVVIYNRSNMDDTNGLSVYFLNYNKQEAEMLLSAYHDVALSSDYYDFLTKYKNFVTGERRVSRKVYPNLNEQTTDTGIKIDLPSELVENYQSGEVVIYRKLGDNKYMPVYRSSEVELDGSSLQATSYKLQFVIEVKNGEETKYGWTALAEKERTESYADYVAFGVLWYDTNQTFLTPKGYEMYVRVPSGSDEGQVRDIRVSSDTNLASKMSFDRDKIDIIEFTVGTYKLFNDAGELDYNMESLGNIYGTGADLGKGDEFRIKLVDLNFDFGDLYSGEFNDIADYYAGFVVHDTQGDTHRLNLVHIDQ